MATCIDLLNHLDPNCDALNKFGGVKKRVWLTQHSALDAQSPFSFDNGFIDGVTMAVINSVPQTLKKFIGKNYKNGGTFPVEVGDSVNTINQTLNLVLYYSTPEDLEAMEQLINADDVVAFVENNDGTIQVYGVKFGLNCSAGDGGTGVALNDDTGYTITLSGLEPKFPHYFRINPSATLPDNVAYLDALT